MLFLYINKFFLKFLGTGGEAIIEKKSTFGAILNLSPCYLEITGKY